MANRPHLRCRLIQQPHCPRVFQIIAPRRFEGCDTPCTASVGIGDAHGSAGDVGDGCEPAVFFIVGVPCAVAAIGFDTVKVGGGVGDATVVNCGEPTPSLTR